MYTQNLAKGAWAKYRPEYEKVLDSTAPLILSSPPPPCDITHCMVFQSMSELSEIWHFFDKTFQKEKTSQRKEIRPKAWKAF